MADEKKEKKQQRKPKGEDGGGAAAPKARRDIPLEVFAAHPQASLPTLSPDGREIAAVYRGDGQRVVVVRPALEGVGTLPRAIGAVRSRPLWLRWTKDRVLLSVERFQRAMLMDETEGPARPPIPIYNRRGGIVGWDVPPQPPRKELTIGEEIPAAGARTAAGGGPGWPR